MPPLTDTAIRNAKAQDKQYKISDERGLYLLVKNSGKYFRLDYRYHGKRKTLALGVYPEVRLKEAREKRDDARKLLQNDIDPAALRKETKTITKETTTNSFELVAREWFVKNKNIWTEGHSRTVIRRLERDIFPWLGGTSVAKITAPEILTALRRVEDRGATDTAHRIKQICGQVFRYAIATGKAERDPSSDLKGALTPVIHSHMAAITDPKEVGGLMRAIEGYNGNLITRCALRLAPLVFVRPGELRHAEWDEFDLDKAEWKIPAGKMKKKITLIIPLARQALVILEEIKPLTGNGKYIFPSIRSPLKPMSNNTVLAALRRMGYSKDEMTGHGFRGMASTLLNEQGCWPPDAIERQLAHIERNKIRAAYNYAQHLPERREMMQAWADYLEKLKGNQS